MDFEKIRLETVKEFEDKVIKQNDSTDDLINLMVKFSSQIAKSMLIKYHEELNSK